jgi:serine phosphatase RsbU (regulator of sigma subunit)
MKIILLLLFFATTSLSYFAQDYAKNYEELDKKLQKKEFDACFTLGNEFISTANGNNKPDWVARFSILTGEAAFELKKYKEANALLQTSFATFKNEYDVNSYLATLIGDAYYQQGDLENFTDWHEKAFEIEKSNNQDSKAFKVANNIAILLSKKKQYKNSLVWFGKAEKIGSTDPNMVSLYVNLGKTYSNYGDYTKSQSQFQKAQKLAISLGDKKSENLINELLSTLAENEAANEAAITSYEEEVTTSKNIEYNNAILSQAKTIEEIEKLSDAMQLIEYKLKAQADEYEKEILQEKVKVIEKEKELELSEANLKLSKVELSEEKALRDKKEAQILALIIGVVSILGILVLLLFSNRSKQRKNRELAIKNTKIKYQKEEIESKANLIGQSIQYAERIQNAALPSKEDFCNKFKNSFVFFQPKSYVSGDFLWHKERDEFLYLAVVDCTGHGVPGAFMSIICNDILTEILNEHKTPQPNEILEFASTKLKKRFELASGSSIKDGMDLAMIRLNLNNGEVAFSGARNPLYVISDNILTEYKGTRRSVSSVDNVLHTTRIDFQLTSLKLKKGDSLYLFSDGYADQKGGELGKKLYYKPFKELIESINSLDAITQNEKLSTKFQYWKNSHEQIDDVTVVGFKY